MKRVLLVSTTTGYQLRAFAKAADASGIGIVFATDRCEQLDDPWRDDAIPVRFHQPETSAEAVVRAVTSAGVDGVLALGDRATVVAAQVTARLGLPGNPPAAAAASRSKLDARRAFRSAGLFTPAYTTVPVDQPVDRIAPSVAYPAVLKPLALSGSRGVIRVEDAGELETACARVRKILQGADVRVERDPLHDYLLIESYVPGEEFAVEGLLTHGHFRPLAIFDKPDPLVGPFFEETIYVTPSRADQDTQREIGRTVAAACAALGLRHGPIHAECRVVPGNAADAQTVCVLEVAARPIGGLCATAVRFCGADGQAVSLEALLLRHAAGDASEGYEREAEASGVMMIPIPKRGVFRGVEGIDRALAVDGITGVEITAKPEVVLLPLPEGRSYLGFIFARVASPDAVEQALRKAYGCLRFEIERDLPLVR